MEPNDALEFYPLATLFPPLNHWVRASGLSTTVDPVVVVEAATVEIWHSTTTESGCPPRAPAPTRSDSFGLELSRDGHALHAGDRRVGRAVSGFPACPVWVPACAGGAGGGDPAPAHYSLPLGPAEEDDERLAPLLEQFRAEALAPVTDD
jgi:hypothetical protein